MRIIAVVAIVLIIYFFSISSGLVGDGNYKHPQFASVFKSSGGKMCETNASGKATNDVETCNVPEMGLGCYNKAGENPIYQLRKNGKLCHIPTPDAYTKMCGPWATSHKEFPKC